MLREDAIVYFKQCNSKIVSVCKDENEYDYEKQEIISDCARTTYEANRLALEALEQEPKTGHWIYENVLYSRCSECGEHAIIANWSKVLSDFCPKCGAKMVEPHGSELENPFNDNRFGG